MRLLNNFNEFVSNTFAGTSNNYILKWENPQVVTGRIYYKICEYGEFNYKFLFSNTVDSTFDDGKVAYANLKGGKWKILSANVGDGGKNPKKFNEAKLIPLNFCEESQREVLEGEMFWSDEIRLNIPKGHYLVFEWTVEGNDIPYTPDKITPSFIKDGDKFKKSEEFPQPHLVACNRNTEKRIAFLGDSITQGLGTRYGKYEFWVSEIGKRLKNDVSVWNLGLGYGRASDAASDGAWLKKAKEMDLVSVCFGVNDILQGRNEKEICDDLLSIANNLKDCGCEVGLFTVPAFDWSGENEKTWRAVNKYINEELSTIVDYVFDTVKIWGKKPPNDNKSKYGPHPNGKGGLALAKAFVDEIDIKRFK
ncbi:MAG: SGNH/GDSL hydrolase family protein [Oscillospiraceae bacterium]